MASRRPEPPGGGTLDLFAPRAPSTLPAPAAAPTIQPLAPLAEDAAGPGSRGAALPAAPPPASPLVAPDPPAPLAALSQAPSLAMAAASAAPLGAPPRAPTPPEAAAAPPVRTYKVAELVRAAGRALEARFAEVWVEGEVSGFRPQASGHAYFNLRDPEAVLPAIMFRSAAARLRFKLADGQHVRARGRLSVYEGSGKFQMIVEAMEPVGVGALQLAFEQLKQQLSAEGLFAVERKRPLPFLPRRIGVATSASGAVVRDIIRVAARRGRARLLLAPCQVQGEGAAEDIVRALAALARVPDVDVIIVGRGGGSLEDLAAFNDEKVARAIARCPVPVISAVGHEVDYTIADFVADRRAATPSQAAEIAVQVHDQLADQVAELSARLSRAGRRRLDDAGQRLDDQRARLGAAVEQRLASQRRTLLALESRLRVEHPRARLLRNRAELTALSHRLSRRLPERLLRARQGLLALATRLPAAMQQELRARRARLDGARPRLLAAVHKQAARQRHQLGGLMSALHAMSPLRVLDRGYALVRGAGDHLVASAAALQPGDPVRLQFARGEARATVTSVDPGPPAPSPPPPPANDRERR